MDIDSKTIGQRQGEQIRVFGCEVSDAGFPKALRGLISRMRLSLESVAELVNALGVFPRKYGRCTIWNWTHGKSLPPRERRKAVLRGLKEKERELRPMLERIYDNICWARDKGFSLAEACQNAGLHHGVLGRTFSSGWGTKAKGLSLDTFRRLDNELQRFRELYANLEAFSSSKLKKYRKAAGLTQADLARLVQQKLVNKHSRLSKIKLEGLFSFYESNPKTSLGTSVGIRPELWEVVLDCLREHYAKLTHLAREVLQQLLEMGYGLWYIAYKTKIVPSVLYAFARGKRWLRLQEAQRVYEVANNSLVTAKTITEHPSGLHELRLAAGISVEAIAAYLKDAGFPRGRGVVQHIDHRKPGARAGVYALSPEEWGLVLELIGRYKPLTADIRKRYRQLSQGVNITPEILWRAKLDIPGHRLSLFLTGASSIWPHQIEAIDEALKRLEQEAPWLRLVNPRWLKTRLRELGVSLPKACESLGCRLYGKSNRRVLSLWFFHSARRWTFEQAKAVWDLYGSPELLPQPSQATSATGNGTAGDANQLVRRRGSNPPSVSRDKIAQGLVQFISRITAQNIQSLAPETTQAFTQAINILCSYHLKRKANPDARIAKQTILQLYETGFLQDHYLDIDGLQSELARLLGCAESTVSEALRTVRDRIRARQEEYYAERGRLVEFPQPDDD